eukprot:6198084-Pleurochrysis_carterae.AAC.3
MPADCTRRFQLGLRLRAWRLGMTFGYPVLSGALSLSRTDVARRFGAWGERVLNTNGKPYHVLIVKYNGSRCVGSYERCNRAAMHIRSKALPHSERRSSWASITTLCNGIPVEIEVEIKGGLLNNACKAQKGGRIVAQSVDVPEERQM